MDTPVDVFADHSVAAVGMDSDFLVARAADEQLVRRIYYLLSDYVVRRAGGSYRASEARTKRTADYRAVHRGGFGGESRCRCRCQTGRCQGRLCLGAGRPDRIETPGRLAGIRLDYGGLCANYRSVCCRNGRCGVHASRCGYLDGFVRNHGCAGADTVVDLCADVSDSFP